MVDEETVSLHIEEYLSENKLKPKNSGSSSKLTPAQAEELEAHLEEVCYVKAEDICTYIDPGRINLKEKDDSLPSKTKELKKSFAHTHQVALVDFCGVLFLGLVCQ